MHRSCFSIARNSIDGIPFKRKIINLMCLFYILIWTLVPAFSVHTNRGMFRILFAIIVFMWILTAFENLPKRLLLNLIMLAGVFFVIMGLYAFLHYGDLGFYDVVNYVLLFGFALNSVLYYKIDSKKLDRRIIVASLFFVAVTSLTTVKGLLTNVNAARMLTSSSTDVNATELLRGQNIGAFDFIYGLVIIFPVLICAFRKTRKKLYKVCVLLMTILIVVCVVRANFTTALLLIFIGFWLPFIFSSEKNVIGKLLIISIIAIVLPILFPLFLKTMYNITTSTLAKEKIMAIFLYMNGSGNAGDVTSRVSLFKLSISSFLHNPIWGVGGYYRTTTASYIGKHAQFIDDLARYGIIGGIPLISFVIYSIKNSIYVKKNGTLFKSSFFPSLIIFCLLGFLNPIYNYGVLVCFFIVATTMARYIDRGNI